MYIIYYRPFGCFAMTLSAQNEPPRVEQIQMSVNAAEETVTIDYEVSDQEGEDFRLFAALRR